jgi:hypothetical protein
VRGGIPCDTRFGMTGESPEPGQPPTSTRRGNSGTVSQISIQEMSHPTILVWGCGDITPEFSGRPPTP